jgi:Xaa-Pro aminopeptidase
MTQPNGWKVLNAGREAELVLAVDFATTGRSDSSFSDLAALLAPHLTVWETRQPPTATGMSAQDYLALWADGVAGSGRTVRAVLGYCAGSVFAGELAARIADHQAQAPHLVVFDPEVPSRAGLYRDFAAMMDQFASVLSPQEVAAAHQEGAAAQAAAPDFAAYGDELVRIFTERAGAAFAREELDTELLDEFAAVFRSFVSYLNAARQIDPAPAWRTATAVSSRNPTEGAALAGRSVEVAVDHAEILRSRRVAEAVNEIIGAYASS